MPKCHGNLRTIWFFCRTDAILPTISRTYENPALTGEDLIEPEHVSPLHALMPGQQVGMHESWFALQAPAGAAQMSAADLRTWIERAIRPRRRLGFL